jgi:hypothetical protein
VGELLAAVGARKWLLARVDASVLFEVMLELERFLAVRAFELSQLGIGVVRSHVSLQLGDALETFVANGACQIGAARVGGGLFMLLLGVFFACFLVVVGFVALFGLIGEFIVVLLAITIIDFVIFFKKKKI